MPQAIISTGALDRANDRIDPGGVNISSFLKGDRWVSLGHQKQIRVGKVTAIKVLHDRLEASWDWLTTPVAVKARAAFERGELDSASISVNKATRMKNREGGYDYTACSLTDITLTPSSYAMNHQARALPDLHGGIRDALAGAVTRAFARSGGDPLPDPAAVTVNYRGLIDPRPVVYGVDSNVSWAGLRDELKTFRETTPAWARPASSDRVLVHETAPNDLKWLSPHDAAFVRERAQACGLIR